MQGEKRVEDWPLEHRDDVITPASDKHEHKVEVIYECFTMEVACGEMNRKTNLPQTSGFSLSCQHP